MGTNKVSVDIERPAPEVFRHFLDSELVKGWVGGLQVIEPLTEGDLRVGSRDKFIVKMGSMQAEMFSEVTEFEMNRLLRQRVTAKGTMGFVEDAAFELEELGGITRVTIRAEWKYATWIGRLMAPLIAVAAGRKLQEDLAQLKINVERG